MLITTLKILALVYVLTLIYFLFINFKNNFKATGVVWFILIALSSFFIGFVAIGFNGCGECTDLDIPFMLLDYFIEFYTLILCFYLLCNYIRNIFKNKNQVEENKRQIDAYSITEKETLTATGLAKFILIIPAVTVTAFLSTIFNASKEFSGYLLVLSTVIIYLIIFLVKSRKYNKLNIKLGNKPLFYFLAITVFFFINHQYSNLNLINTDKTSGKCEVLKNNSTQLESQLFSFYSTNTEMVPPNTETQKTFSDLNSKNSLTESLIKNNECYGKYATSYNDDHGFSNRGEVFTNSKGEIVLMSMNIRTVTVLYYIDLDKFDVATKQEILKIDPNIKSGYGTIKDQQYKNILDLLESK